MDRKRVFFAVVIVVVLAAALGPLGCRRRATKSRQLRFGYLPIASDLSFFVALDRHFFASAGLDIEPVKFETSNQAFEALVAGRIDAAAPLALEAALALEANTPSQFKILEMTAATATTRVHRIVVRPHSAIRTLRDLRGREIGTFPGSQMVVFLKLILGRFLDPEREVTIRQIKANLQPQALEAGQVDALFCLEPTCTQLERRGLGRAVSVNPLYEFIQRPFPTAASVVATRLCRENPQLVSQILSALRAVHAEIRSSPEKAAAVLPQYTPIEPDLAPFIALYDYWGVESIDRDAVQRLANLYADKGIIPKRVVTADLYASGK